MPVLRAVVFAGQKFRFRAGERISYPGLFAVAVCGWYLRQGVSAPSLLWGIVYNRQPVRLPGYGLRKGCVLVIPARRFSPPPPRGEGLGVGGKAFPAGRVFIDSRQLLLFRKRSVFGTLAGSEPPTPSPSPRGGGGRTRTAINQMQLCGVLSATDILNRRISEKGHSGHIGGPPKAGRRGLRPAGSTISRPFRRHARR